VIRTISKSTTAARKLVRVHPPRRPSLADVVRQPSVAVVHLDPARSQAPDNIREDLAGLLDDLLARSRIAHDQAIGALKPSHISS